MYCSACLQRCDVTTIDEGIGSYEYWGATYNDVSKADVSDCCNADYFESLSDAIDYEGLSIMEALKILELDSKAMITMAALLDDMDVSNGEVIEAIVNLVNEVTVETKKRLRSTMKTTYRPGAVHGQWV